MDDRWICGGTIESIVATLEEGGRTGCRRSGKIPDEQVWHIAAYVRSLSGAVRKDVDPSRRDNLSARPAENRLPPARSRGGEVRRRPKRCSRRRSAAAATLIRGTCGGPAALNPGGKATAAVLELFAAFLAVSAVM